MNSDENQLSNQIRYIANRLLDGQCRLFIGAGIPEHEANLPGTSELTEALIKRMRDEGFAGYWIEDLFDESNDTLCRYIPFGIAAEFNGPREHREKMVHFVEDFLRHPEPSGKSYTTIRALAQKTTRDGSQYLLQRIYTTNYDTSIKQALGALDHQIISHSNQRAFDRVDARIQIVHLHGVVDRGSADWIITDDDEMGALTEPYQYNLLHNALINDLGVRTIVFIGYSLRDTSFKRLHYLVRKHSGDAQSTHFAVLPSIEVDAEPELPKVAEYQIYREIWKNRGIEFIDLSAAEFFRQLANRVSVIEVDDRISFLAAEYNRDPDQIRELAHRLAEEFHVDIPEALDLFEPTLS